MISLPKHARAVIIGGGIVGCSTAYHLGKLGWKDVVLLEKHKLTSGSTFHAAGLVGQLRSNANITQLLKYSVELYNTLEQETGLGTGWKMNGGLRLACNKERMIENARQATTAQSFGLEMHMLSPKEAQDLWPMMDISDVHGAAYLPTDGQANPSDITMALARGARNRGVNIVEECTVKGIQTKDGRATGVSTNLGDIACEIVVNCGGQWAYEIGLMAGVCVPMCSVEHQFMITEPIEGITSGLPTLRDPDRLTYFKEDVGGLVMGGYEPNPIPWAQNGIPEGFNFTLLDSDWDHFEQLMEQALIRVPALETAGIRTLTNGPEAFTPDGNFILGEAPELDNFYVGAGFNAFGIAAGGGAGKALAEWIVAGEPSLDLWPVDIRRFGNHHRDPDWVHTRTLELYGKHYTMSWPHEEHESARPVRTSALYDVLKDAGACFGEKMAWERPNWFAPHGTKAEDEYSFDRQNWFPHVGNEHQAVRERVAVFDQSSFAKFLVSGPDAEKALSWICANDVSRAPGSLIYTQMLNSRGCIECDLTVVRLTEDQYYLVTGTGYRTHDFDWIRHNIPEGSNVTLEDITDAHCTLSLMGPRARDVLEQITDTDVSNSAFPFGTAQVITIAGAPVKALRITYVGELGWELHFPIEFARPVYEALMAAGEKYGIANAGYRAIESLRLEKGYRAWSSDIGPDYSPFESGLGWAVKLKTNTPFMGRDAASGVKQKTRNKQLACFTVDDPDVVLLGRETIYRDGERVGWLSSGGWGYTIGKNIGYGYVRNPDGVSMDYLKSGRYEIDIATRRVPCSIHFEALVDPEMDRIKG